MASNIQIIQVAVPCPLYKTFSYLVGEAFDITPGQWVRVPFGQRRVAGLVMDFGPSDFDESFDLKEIIGPIEHIPTLRQDLLHLVRWSIRYYHASPWEIIGTAIPVKLLDTIPAAQNHWLPTPQVDLNQVQRAPRQQEMLEWLILHSGASDSQIRQAGFSAAIQRQLANKGLIRAVAKQSEPSIASQAAERVKLNHHQLKALSEIDLTQFVTYLLEGPTGSGKTEIYIELIQQVVNANRQALILVPEIGLTPQIEARFRDRLAARVAIYHSGMNDSERRRVWQAANTGELDVIVGTRSAIFLPFCRLGLIALDEEHDTSYKQQEGWRYHARNIASIRASQLNIPLILGSATPSLESLLNLERGKYRGIHLHERHGNASLPGWQIITNSQFDRLSDETTAQLSDCIKRGEQALIFLNRRGFAPGFRCQSCKWIADCHSCSSRLTVHLKAHLLSCHHCGFEREIPSQCPQCQSKHLEMVGLGTERLESTLGQQFKATPVIRIDRDSTRNKGALRKKLDQIGKGEPAILIGTQMLAKGHHFPNVTLAVILGIDRGLQSADPCALEQSAQLCVQVAGRSGRGDKPGQAIIETGLPDHPAIKLLTSKGYLAFAQNCLQQKLADHQPPASFWSQVIAEHADFSVCRDALQQVADLILNFRLPDLQVLGPLPCLLERRGNRFRYQLQIQAQSRSTLHQASDSAVSLLDGLAKKARFRWSLDIDPVGID